RPRRAVGGAGRAAGPAAGGEPDAAGPPPAPAVHGGGVRRGEPLPVLLLLPRPAVDRERPPGPPARGRRFHDGGGETRPASGVDVRGARPDVVGAGGLTAGRPAPPVPRPPGGPAALAGAAGFPPQGGPAAARPGPGGGAGAGPQQRPGTRHAPARL